MNFGDIYALVLKEYPDILTVDEMSKALGVSTKTGYQLLRENKIEHLKVGRAYSCLPLRPPQMSLGLPFNQYRLYPHMNFGLAAQSWHDNLPTRSFTVVLLSPLGFPIQVSR